MPVKSQFFINPENQLHCTAEFVSKALKDLLVVLIVFITAKNMSCIHIKQLVSGMSENSPCTLKIGWNE